MTNVADIHPPCDTLLNVDGTSAGMVIENRLSDDGETRVVTVLHNGATTFHAYDLGDHVSIERRADCGCDT